MTQFSRFPFVRLLLPFLFGILGALAFPVKHPLVIFFLFLLFLVILLLGFTKLLHQTYRRRWMFGALVNLLLIVAGYQLTIAKTEIYNNMHFSTLISIDKNKGGTVVIANVINPLEIKAKSLKTTVEIKRVLNNGLMQAVSGYALIYIAKDSASAKICFGDRLLLHLNFQEVSPPANPGEFDHKNYLANLGVFHRGYIKSGGWIKLENSGHRSLQSYAFALREKLIHSLRETGLSSEALSLVSALTLGYTGEMATELKSSYSSAGVIHVLSVSGLHVGIIYLALNALLFFFNRVKYGRVIKAIVLIILLWFYAFLTGMSPSVMRAATMLSFVVAGNSLNQYTNIYNTLAVSAFLLLVINPFLITNIGFQLSYVAVFGIVFLYPKIYNLWHLKNWLLDKIWALICVSIAAQAVTSPLSIFYFHQFPNYFLLSNLIVIPLSTLIIYLSLLAFLTAPFSIISYVIVKPLSFICSFLNDFVTWVAGLPGSITDNIYLQGIEVVMLCCGLVYAMAYLSSGKIKHIKYSLMVLLSFLVFQTVKNYIRNTQKKLIVYNIPGFSAYDLIAGKKSIFTADSVLLGEKEKIGFHIKNNWRQLGITQFNQNILRFTGNNTDYSLLGEKRIAYANESMLFSKAGEKVRIDLVYVSGKFSNNISDLSKFYNIGKVVIDSSVKERRLSYLIEECRKLGIPYYSVTRSGAFVYDV